MEKIRSKFKDLWGNSVQLWLEHKAVLDGKNSFEANCYVKGQTVIPLWFVSHCQIETWAFYWHWFAFMNT